MPVKRYNGSSWDVVAGAGVTGAPGTNGTNGTNGLDAAPYVGGKNVIINGGFDIWQRNTTFTNPGAGGAYTADRWCTYFNANATVTQEATVKPDTSVYSLKLTATASSASNDMYQLIEQSQMQHLRGKAVTYSIKIAGTAGLAPQLVATYSTTADDSLFPTGTAISTVIVANPAINASTFVTYAISFTVPTTAKTLRIGVVSNAMANTNVLYLAEAQLELGLAATVFSRAGGTIAGELAACQRYCVKFTPATNNGYERIGVSLGTNSSGQSIFLNLPVEMRRYPTAMVTSGSFAVWNANTTAVSSLALSTTPGTHKAAVFLSATGNSNGFNYFHFNAANPSTDYMLFTAEL